MVKVALKLVPKVHNEIHCDVELRAGHEVVEPLRYDGVLGVGHLARCVQVLHEAISGTEDGGWKK